MKHAARVISIAFTVLSGIFFFYQLAQGNPFHDAVHPALVSGLVLSLGIAGVVLSFRYKR